MTLVLWNQWEAVVKPLRKVGDVPQEYRKSPIKNAGSSQKGSATKEMNVTIGITTPRLRALNRERVRRVGTVRLNVGLQNRLTYPCVSGRRRGCRVTTVMATAARIAAKGIGKLRRNCGKRSGRLGFRFAVSLKCRTTCR